MELRHLRYFIAVAEALSFTRAAQKLHTAQPSLSLQIKNLEEEVGTPLFERTRRKVELTNAGKVFLDEARLVVTQAERALTLARQAAQRERPRLAIGFVPAAEIRIFPNVLPRLRLDCPELSVELDSLPTFRQEDVLLAGKIDVAFMRAPIVSPALTSKVVLSEPLVALLPASHRLASKARISPRDLVDEPFISPHPVYAGAVYTAAREWLDSNGAQPVVAQVASNILLNLNLVGMGLGYTLLPEYARVLASPAVCCRPLDEASPLIELLMVWDPQRRSAELDRMLGLVMETL